MFAISRSDAGPVPSESVIVRVLLLYLPTLIVAPPAPLTIAEERQCEGSARYFEIAPHRVEVSFDKIGTVFCTEKDLRANQNGAF